MISGGDFLHFLGWYLALSLIGVLALPIACRFLPNLPSRGIALARPIGVLVWGFLFWLSCTLGILQNNTGGVVTALLLLGIFSWWVGVRGRLKALLHWLRQNITTLVILEVLFFIAFFAWTLVRAANPEIRYTEKPMELAFINAILRSPGFPPMDPWLSGYAISYYYFGYVIVSMLIRITGVSSSIGFNLAIAAWFALTATAVYGMVFDLLKGRKRKTGQTVEQQTFAARLGAFFGPFFILIAGNFEGVLEFLYARHLFWRPDATGELVSKFWSWLAISELDTPPIMPAQWLPNRMAGWLWWRGSRVLQDLNLAGGRIEVIDEFPFFSYLLADLHPHLLAMPFGLLALGVSLNYFLTPKQTDFLNGSVRDWIKRLEFWFVALILGCFAFLNTWDFPIYLGIFCLVLLYKRVTVGGWGWTRVWDFIRCGLVFGFTALLLYLPFFLGFSSQAGGILPSMEYVTRGIHFWLFFGVLLIPICIWLLVQYVNLQRPRRFFKWFGILLLVLITLYLVSTAFGVFILNLGQSGYHLQSSSNITLARLGEKLLTASQAFGGLHGTMNAGELIAASISRRLTSPGTWITLLLLSVLALSLVARGRHRGALIKTEDTGEDPAAAVEPTRMKYFVALIFLTGAALVTFPEFFYLRDQFGNRMNTIFKFYFLAWILWGIVAAYTGVDLITRLKKGTSQLFTVVLISTVAAGLAYPTVMLGVKTNQFKPIQWTLDGNAFLLKENPDEYQAIEWLSRQPLGVVAEAIGGSYSEYARVSTRTGLPTVLGWPFHESQWRGGAVEIGSRESEIKTLFTSSNWQEIQSIIKKYNIRYVYVGNLEKSLYKTDMEQFKQNLALVYQNSTVSIFETSGFSGDTLP